MIPNEIAILCVLALLILWLSIDRIREILKK